MQSWSWRKNDAASFVLSAGTRTSLGDADWRLDFIFSPSLNARTALGPATASAGEPGKADTRLANGPSGQLPTFPPLHRYLSESLQGSTKRAKPKTGKLHFQHLVTWYRRMRAYSEESQN